MSNCKQLLIDNFELASPSSLERVYFGPFLLLDNSSKNSILNWILKLNLVQQLFLNLNAPNNASFYHLTKHWILILRPSPASWLKICLTVLKINGRSTVIDRRNKVCDCQKALLNSHHGPQYLDVTTTFTSFNYFTTFSKTIFAIFWNSKPNSRQKHCSGN